MIRRSKIWEEALRAFCKRSNEDFNIVSKMKCFIKKTPLEIRIYDFIEYVRNNISKEDRTDSSIAYEEFKDLYNFKDEIEYPFENKFYQSI